MPKCSSLLVFIHTVTMAVLKLLVFEALGNMTVMYPDELTAVMMRIKMLSKVFFAF